MGLTQRQERLVTLYVREAEKGLGRAPEPVRARLESRLREEVERKLAERGEQAYGEEVVSGILEEMGDPVALGASLAKKPGLPMGLTLSVDDCRWLGVCGGLARHFKLDVRLLRGGAVLAGLLLGPFAVVAYLCVYLELYFTGARGDAPSIKVWPLVKHGLGAVAGLAAIHVAQHLAIWGGGYGFTRWTQKAPPTTLARWDWLLHNEGSVLFWAALCALPLAVLAGLPLANRWSDTVNRMMQAVLALYAVGVFGGVGAYYAGLIMAAVMNK